MKIDQLTVEQYMSVVLKDGAVEVGDAERKQITEKFRFCATSHKVMDPDRELWAAEDAWTPFGGILIMLNYIYKQDCAATLNLNETFKKHGDIFGQKRPRIGTTNIGYTLKTELNDRDYVFTTPLPGKDCEANVRRILEGLKKEDTLRTALRQLWYYVREGKLAGFEEVAQRGFDTEVDPEKWLAGLDQDLLLSRCNRMYRARVKQMVFTGAPGTGKTFTAKSFAKLQIRIAYRGETLAGDAEYGQHMELVQFHASYDYADFVEGLRPIEGENGVSFVRMDGSFKAFCRRILDSGDTSRPYFFIIDEVNRADLSKVFGELMHCLDEANRSDGVRTQYANLPTYRFVNGKPERIDNDRFREKFTIPENLYILATMNDIDRSVEAFDFALRRRFKWIETKAAAEMRSGLEGMLPGVAVEDLAEKVNAMNRVIACEGPAPAGERDAKRGEKLGLTTAYHIGHAYFKDYDGTAESLQTIWNTQIRPILQEYCRGKRAEDVDGLIRACAGKLGVDQ